MNEHFSQIAKAIEYITANYKQQPSLDDVAAHLHMSPFHFQRLFQEWAGVTPKKFLQYITLEHAKSMLGAQKTALATTVNTGLSSTGRLHDLFVQIESMTPGEFKNRAEALTIFYSFAITQFGDVIVASTQKGVCHIAFIESKEDALEELKEKFSNATFIEKKDDFQESALKVFSGDPQEVKLHLRGTPFQLKVWEALLQIPAGDITTYGTLAQRLGTPRASRAVGTAIGDNPVAFIIPCHRVIRATGVLGGYRWGLGRKSAMLGWEMGQTEKKAL